MYMRLWAGLKEAPCVEESFNNQQADDDGEVDMVDMEWRGETVGKTT